MRTPRHRELRERAFAVVEQAALGELELEELGAQPGFDQRRAYHRDELARLELLRRDVHRDAEAREAQRLPARALLARLAQHPLADRHDELRVLGDRQELARQHRAELRVLPAQQRLGADHAAAQHVDDRLVAEHELAALERLAQPLLAGDAPDVLGAAGGRPPAGDPVAPGLLGLVHRRVGALQELLGVAAVVREAGDPDAGRDRLLRGALDRQRLAQQAEHLLGDAQRVLVVDQVGNEDRELVAAQTRAGVALAQAASDALRGEAQQRVARQVAERVVHALEAVEVEEQHGEALAVAPRGGDRLLEPVLEQRPVGEAGELVVGRELARALARDVQLEEHALVADRVVQAPDERARRDGRLHEIAARAHLDRAHRERLVVRVDHHHHRHEGRPHARLAHRRHLLRAARADVHEQDVGLVAVERLEGLRERVRVREGEGRPGVARREQVADPLGVGVAVADQQDPVDLRLGGRAGVDVGAHGPVLLGGRPRSYRQRAQGP